MDNNHNIYPYFDDFDSNKNYLKILFRPGFAVQARELNQLQSILSHQISTIGKSLFTPNSAVFNGKVNITISKVIRVDPTKIADFKEGEIITINNDSFKINRIDGSDLIVSIIKGNLEVGSKIKGSIKILNITDQVVAVIESGIYFIAGKFINVYSHRKIISPTENFSGNIFLNLKEEFVGVDEDVSLVDPSQGYANFNAPGANRSKLTLTLSTEKISTPLEKSYEILKVNNNTILNFSDEAHKLKSMLLEKIYEKTGNYVKNHLEIKAKLEEINDSKEIKLTLSTGKAYINGNEVINSRPKITKIHCPMTTKTFKSEGKIKYEKTVNSLENSPQNTVYQISDGEAVYVLPDSVTGASEKNIAIDSSYIQPPYNQSPSKLYIDIGKDYVCKSIDIIDQQGQKFEKINKTLNEKTNKQQHYKKLYLK